MREVEVGQEGSLENGNRHDSSSGHVQSSNGLRLVQHVLDGLLGERVEAQVDLLDVDKDVGIGGNA